MKNRHIMVLVVHSHIVEELVQIMFKEDLEIQDI